MIRKIGLTSKFMMSQPDIQTQKRKHLENKRSFRDEIKKQFSSFLKGFQLPKIVSDMGVHL